MKGIACIMLERLCDMTRDPSASWGTRDLGIGKEKLMEGIAADG